MPNQDHDLVEHIKWQDKLLCILIHSAFLPEKTTFLTQPEFKQQVGFIVYPAGGEIARHSHRALERRLVGTSEVLIVKKGRCLIDIFNEGHELVTTRELFPGDIVLMLSGGHGFRILEDTVFLEIKQGPYTGLDEKESF